MPPKDKMNRPEVAAEWHQSRNGLLTAEKVTYSSHKKIWWKCKNGHEWEATVDSRNRGTGCPFCSGRLACADNSLAALAPELTLEWNHDKNDSLTPDDVTTGSGKKVWWKCANGHEWCAQIASRVNGRGCPKCAKTKWQESTN